MFHLLQLSRLVVKLFLALLVGLVLVRRSVGSAPVLHRFLLLQVKRQEARKGHGAQDAHHRRQRQHQTHHDAGEVDGRHGVQHNEDALVVDVLDDVPQANGERQHQDVQVEEEREPRGRLVLRNGCDDRNVDLGVARVPQRVEAARPGSDDSGVGQQHHHAEDDSGGAQHCHSEHVAQLGRRHSRLEVSQHSHRVQERENSQGGHVFTGSHRLETWNIQLPS